MSLGTRIDRLFYEIDAETKSFEDGIDRAQKSITAFVDYVKTKPALALAGLALAMGGVAFQAARMAGEVDKGLRLFVTRVPEATNRFAELRKEVERLSLSGPRSQAVLAAAIAEVGTDVTSTDEAMQRLNASLLAADATASDLTRVIGGLDQVLGLFNLSSNQSGESLARLVSIARGRATLDEIFDALQQGAPAIRNFHLDLDTAARALVTLKDRGLGIRQAGAELARYAELGEEGAKAIRTLATGTTDTAAAMREMEKAASDNNKSIDNLTKQTLNNFNAALVNLGNVLLPLVTERLNLLSGATGRARAALADITQDTKIETLELVIKMFDQLDPDGRARAVERLEDAFNGLNRSGLSTEQLITYRDGMVLLLNNTTKTGQSLIAMKGTIKALNDEIARRPPPTSIVTPPVTGATGKPDPEVLSADEIQRRKDAAKQLAEDLLKANDAAKVLGQSIRLSLSEGTASGVDDAEAALANFRERVGDVEAKFASIKKALPSEFVAAVAKEMARLQKVVVDAGIAFEKLKTEAREAARLQIDQIIADGTVTQVDNLRLALTRLIAEIQKKNEAAREKGLPAVFTPDEIQLASDFGEEMIKAQQAIENTDAVIQGIIDTKGKLRLEDFFILVGQLKVLEQEKKGLANGQARQKIQEKINDLLREMKALSEGISDASSGETDEAETRKQKAIELARTIEESARAALQLADAFGLVDSESAKALQSIVQIGTAIGRIAGGDIVGGAFSLLGGLASLVSRGPDPEDIRAQEIQQKNTEALERLTKAVGDFGVDISGAQIARVSQTITNTTRSVPFFDVEGFRISLRNMGSSMGELQEVADFLGVTLDTSSPERFRQSIADLDAAIKASEFTTFAKTFAGQLNLLNASFDLFDKSDPAEKFKEFVDLLVGEFGSGLFAGLEGIDINTAEGRSAAQSIIDSLFEEIRAGTLDIADLGGLTPQEFLDALRSIGQFLDDATPPVVSFADAFGDLARSFGIFDTTTLGQFAAAVDLFAEKFPELGDVFDGINLDTAEGVEAARELVRGLFEDALESGNEALIAALLIFDGIIDRAGAEIAEGIETLADRINAAISDLNLSFDLLDIDDPTEQFKQFIETIKGFAPALADGLSGLDVSTEAGRKQAKDFIKGILEKIVSGDIDLGGLSREEFLELLTDANRILESIPADIAEELADPSKASRTAGSLAAFGATERTVVRMTDLQASTNLHLRQIRDMIAGNMVPLAPLLPPSMPGGFSVQSGSGTTIRITMTNHFGAGMSAPDAEAAGLTIGDAVVRQIDRLLGREVALSAMQTGTRRVA